MSGGGYGEGNTKTQACNMKPYPQPDNVYNEFVTLKNILLNKMNENKEDSDEITIIL